MLGYLKQHLPVPKAQNILDYLQKHNCSLQISKPRKTKRGDFRVHLNKCAISINRDTNSFRFLFTLIHEMAHLETFIQHKNAVKPHGIEWKINFKKLYYAFEIDEVFSIDKQVAQVVKKELEDPKACSGIDILIERAFSTYDENKGNYLEQVPDGGYFKFRSHTYQKLETRRTRVICLNLANKRKYTINRATIVDLNYV